MPDTFFKVRYLGMGLVAVEYRQRRRIGSRLLATSHVLPAEHASGHAAVEFGKRRAVQRYEERQSSERKLREALEEEEE